jgi:anti-anti-sigma factor
VLRLHSPDGNAAAQRPQILDLVDTSDAGLAAAVRDGWRGPRGDGCDLVVIDLGERRTLPADAVEELFTTHRALRRARGRCALVVGPALAAQLSLAHPEGIIWAADRRAAINALGPRLRPIAAAAVFRPRRRSLHVELKGEIDLAQVPAVEALLATTLPAAREHREIVFDLTELAFVDLVGLRAITAAAVRCQLAGAPTRVTGAGSQVRRLVRHLGWEQQLPGIDDPRPTRHRDTAAAERGG